MLPLSELAGESLPSSMHQYLGVGGHLIMAKIRVLFENGDPERVIEFDPAKAPFQHDGKPGSILDVLLAHGVHLEHACGGNCACTTCHVIVKNGGAVLSEAEESELD